VIYDISVLLHEGMPVFPGDPTFKRSLTVSLEKGDPANTSHLDFCAHAGTHIDAPYHMMKSDFDVTQFSPEMLMGPARVVAIEDPHSITETELKKLDLKGVSRILFKTRNSTFWKEKEFRKDFVYIEPSAAQYLGALELQLVGLDYLSVEKFGSEVFPTHTALMEKKIIILEGINLAEVLPGDYILFCGALRIQGSDGAPARVFLVDRQSLASWGC